MNNKNNKDGSTRTRRRGHDLEVAILKATWDELQETGYTSLTMEGVAARARTSKAAVYRRWSNRGELVLAAIRQYGLLSDTVPIPDTGALRSDVLVLLRQRIKQLMKVKSKTIYGLLAEGQNGILSEIITSRQPHMRSANLKVMHTILERAAERGEIIQLDQIPPKVITLPIDLTRHELLFSGEPISEETMVDIVDDIFLPLISKKPYADNRSN